MPTEKPVLLTEAEGDALVGPFEDTRVLDVDDVTFSALGKLKEHAALFSGNEELAADRDGPLPRVIGDPDIWFLDLISTEELPLTGEEPLQAMVVQHCQNAMSKLNESIRHAHEGNRERVLRDAALLGLYAKEIARRIKDAPEWPEPRPT